MAAEIVNEQPLAEFLRDHYNLGSVVVEERLETQGRRAAYRVRGADGQWAAKLTDPARSESSVRADTGALLYLAGQGFPAPRLLPARDGRLYLPYEDRCVYLYTYIEGGRPRPADGFYRRLGGLLARLHCLPVVDGIPRSDYRPEEMLPGVRQALAAVRQPDQLAAAAELLQMAEGFPSFADLPEGIQHSDPYFVNLIEDRQGQLHLIDWDDGGLAYPLLDAAYAVAHLCTFTARDRQKWGAPGPSEGLVWRPDWAAEFLGAYQAVRPLTRRERERFADAVRLSFLIYIPFGDERGLIMENYQRLKMVDWDWLAHELLTG